MRPFFTLFVLALLGTSAHAQITLERQDFTLEAGTRVTAWFLDYSNASAPQPGEGMVWDFSELTMEDGFYTDYEVPDSDEFPTANILEPTSRTILGDFSRQEGVFYNLLDESGYRRLGNVAEFVSDGLGAFTGMPGDTLKVLSSVFDYAEPELLVKFPMDFGDTWTYDNTITTDFRVTVVAFGLQDAPASQVSKDSVHVSVAGYGTLLLPNPSGIGTVSVEALMIERNRTVTHNYFLGG